MLPLIRILFISFFCFLAGLEILNAQSVISGKVVEVETGEPIPFCNITVLGKFGGTSSDVDGEFSMEINRRNDSIVISAIGYQNQKLAVDPNVKKFYRVELKKDEVSLGEITVSAEMDPALILFRRIVKNKHKHNVHQFDNISFEVYNKYEVNMLDVTEEAINDHIILSKFPVLTDYIDSLKGEHTTVLPLFFIESIAQIYRQKNPTKVTEQVKGIRVSGVQRKEFIAKLLSSVDQNFNIYNNLMLVFGKNFISPIADYGMNIYQYDLNIYDTLFIQGVPHFEMEFKPKRKGEYTFKGSMIVNIENYAIASIQADMVGDINVELIKSLKFNMSFAPKMMQINEDSSTLMWIPDREYMELNMNYLFGKEAKILAKKTSSYKNIDISSEIDVKEFNAFEASNIEDGAGERSDSFWVNQRHMGLNDTEQGIYDMVDSLKRTRTYKVLEYLTRTATSGYAKVGPIGFGPITSAVSRNTVEGWRFRMGIRTNTDFSDRVQLMLYGAYGLDDERVKYGGEFDFILSKKPWNKLTLAARTDVDLMSRHAEELDQDNIFTIIQKRNTSQRFYNIDEYRIIYNTEFHRDLSAKFSAEHKRLTPGFSFKYEEGDIFRNEVNTSELGVGFRWQYKSRTLPGTFNREAISNKIFGEFRKKNSFPVFFVKYTVGLRNIIQSDFTYHDVSLGIRGNVRLNSKMSVYYYLRGGKIYGTLPFILLKVPEGNFSYIHNQYSFNNMNILEFVSDQYASLNFQYFLGGTILDKIPGIKKLKWREVITANVFYGDLNKRNREFNRFNEFDVAYPIPYVEAGFGFENIFKVIRIDSIWRITHRDKLKISKWALYLSMYIKV